MYFPYFRGRQYELLALRDLVKLELINKAIIPVIEPIKLSATLNGLIEVCGKSSHPVGLILNPAVGDLSGDTSSFTEILDLFPSSYIIPAVIINKKLGSILSDEQIQKKFKKSDVLAVFSDRDYLAVYREMFNDNSPKYNLIPEDRQIRREVKGNKVLFEDRFNKQPKNAQYPEEEFFSDDHLFFNAENYVGFGDYSIVGNEFNEGGWAPYAVVIHMVYFADDDTLRIKHFISDTNDNPNDVAGKFYEAVSKLNTWAASADDKQMTYGLSTYLKHFQNGTYPGLPTLKKLSIMHHLELISKYIKEGET